MKNSTTTDRLLLLIRDGSPVSLKQQLQLTVLLSIPSIVMQLSSIVMQYIDAAMVGSLGAGASASIGLVSTTTWLFSGLCGAAATGFSVQVAHRIGAGDFDNARWLLRQAMGAVLLFSLGLMAVGTGISGHLPHWLGGDESICAQSSTYFFIYAMGLPVFQLNYLAGSMLRCSGNMRVPSMLGVLMCVLDVVFNFFLIFPSREVGLGSIGLFIPGAGLGVGGAALGTVLAEVVSATLMVCYLWRHSPMLNQQEMRGRFLPTSANLRNAVKIGLPMGIEHAMICGAQIMTTVIVAPLGIFAIAANSFAITAESLCYMPGYGIADAATTLVGQGLGAGRRRLTRRFAYITVVMGMVVMGIMGCVMYVGAPFIMSSLTPVDEIRSLGSMTLRIEAFAEPMFAAAIVSYGVFVGAASTLVPCFMNLFSIWAVRLSLAAVLAPTMGLKGVWLAMCIELCFRGLIFLIRLKRGKWMRIPQGTAEKLG